jgi:hypothetical protein
MDVDKNTFDSLDSLRLAIGSVNGDLGFAQDELAAGNLVRADRFVRGAIDKLAALQKAMGRFEDMPLKPRQPTQS